jgi:hypothetical protein
MSRSFRFACLAAALAACAAAPAVRAAGMDMEMSGAPAHFAPTRAAYTGDHRYLIKLLELPNPIPYEKYFSLRLAVYEGHAPHKKLGDAQVQVVAGMRHGMKHGFAHMMESDPKLASAAGEITVSGMYFHMMGPWIMEVTVSDGGMPSVASFKLPCCGK